MQDFNTLKALNKLIGVFNKAFLIGNQNRKYTSEEKNLIKQYSVFANTPNLSTKSQELFTNIFQKLMELACYLFPIQIDENKIQTQQILIHFSNILLKNESIHNYFKVLYRETAWVKEQKTKTLNQGKTLPVVSDPLTIPSFFETFCDFSTYFSKTSMISAYTYETMVLIIAIAFFSVSSSTKVTQTTTMTEILQNMYKDVSIYLPIWYVPTMIK